MMNKAFQECIGCNQKWHQPNTLQSWFADFTGWVSVGNCALVTSALIPGQTIVVPQKEFYPCLEEWFLTDQGRN